MSDLLLILAVGALGGFVGATYAIWVMNEVGEK